MATVTGTFTGTGQSDPIVGREIDIAMSFAGAASVDVERRIGVSTWIKIDTAITADYNDVARYPAPVAIRLNCTAHTGDVTYVMQTGKEG